jgi:hypothetical protein
MAAPLWRLHGPHRHAGRDYTGHQRSWAHSSCAVLRLRGRKALENKLGSRALATHS